MSARISYQGEVDVMTYEVTGMSPQSITLPQELKGLSPSGLKGRSAVSLDVAENHLHIVTTTEAHFA